MIKAVLFDADGVLINAKRFSIKLARDYGISTDLTLPFFNGIFQDCLINKADLKIELGKELPNWGWKGSIEEFLDTWFQSEHKIEQPMIDFIQKLRNKGIKCFVATNNEKYRVEYMTKQMGFGDLLDKVYSSASLGYKKPDMEFFESILYELGLKKKEVLFWDDTEDHVNAAKEFGVNAEAYTSFTDFKNKMQSYIL